MSPSPPSTLSPGSNCMEISSAFGNRVAKPLSLSPTTSAKRFVWVIGSCFFLLIRDGCRRNSLLICRAHATLPASSSLPTPAELPTLSRAVPNPRLEQRNETIPPGLSFFRDPDCPLGLGFSRETLVAGLVAGPAAGGGLSENNGHGWHSAKRYRYHHATAAHWLCYRSHWWIAARAANRALESFSRYHRDPGARPANFAQRVLGPACPLVVRPNRGRHALCRGNGNALVRRHRNRYWCAPCPADLPTGRSDHGFKTFAHLAKGDLAGSPPIYR